MSCRDVKAAVSSAGHVKKSVYLHSTGQGLVEHCALCRYPQQQGLGEWTKEKLGDCAGRVGRGWLA